MSGGTYNLGGNTQTLASLSGTGGTISGTSTLTVNQSTDTTFGGQLTSTLALVKNGSGNLTLTGTISNFSGATTLNAGRLTLANASGSALGTSNLTLNGGTLASGAAGGSMTGSVSAGGAAHAIAPAGPLTLTTGSLYLNSNTTLDFSSLLGGGAIGLSAGAINFSGSTPVNVVVPQSGLLNSSYTLIDAASVGTAIKDNFTGTMPSGYGLDITSGGDLVLKQVVVVVPNYWMGTANLNWNVGTNWSTGSAPNTAGAVALFSGSTGAGWSPVNVDGATTVGGIQYDGSSAAYTIGGSALTMDNGGSDAIITLQNGAAAQVISSALNLNSNLQIRSNTSGLTLNSPVTGSGKTLMLVNGRLLLAAQDILAAVSTLSVSGGTLDMNGYSQSIGSLAGAAGTITGTTGLVLTINQSADQSFGGQITGDILVIKNSAAALTLSGSNNYTGNTTINNGTLKLGAAAPCCPYRRCR